MEEKKFKTGLLALSGALLIAFIALCLYMYNTGKQRDADVFLIPKDYTGMVTVQYGVDDAPDMPREGDYYVNKIEKDGKLDSSLPRPEYVFPRGDDKFYFVDDQGNRTAAVVGVNVHGGDIVYDGADDVGKGRFFVGTPEAWAEVLKQLNEEEKAKKKMVRTGM